MLSKEPFIRNDSNYFVYSPSKNAMEMFLYPLQCGQFTYLPGYRLVREAFDSFLLMYIQKGTLALVTGDTWQHGAISTESPPGTGIKTSSPALETYSPSLTHSL